MKRAMGLLVGLMLLTSADLSARTEKCKEVKAREVKAMMDAGGVLVINPLSRIEFNDLAIKGSINIPLEQLEQRLPKEKGVKLVFYCLGPK